MPDRELIQIFGADGGDIELPHGKSGAKPPPEVLPILGLQDVVVFPGMVVPLLVDHPPSIKLIDDVVAGDRFLGLVLQRKADLEDPTPEELYEHGCLVRVLKMLKFPDNSVRILIEGLRRFKIRSFESTEPYLVARVTHQPEVLDATKETAAVARKAQMQFAEIVALSPALAEQVKVNGLNTDQADKLADVITANLNLKLEERQALLANPKVRDRLTTLLPLMRRELASESWLQDSERGHVRDVQDAARLLFARADSRAATGAGRGRRPDRRAGRAQGANCQSRADG